MLGLVPFSPATGSADSPAGTIPDLDYSRLLQMAEVAIAFLAIQFTLWSTGQLRLFFHLFAVLWILSTTLIHRKQFSRLGFLTTASDIRQSAWIIWAAFFLAMALAIAAFIAGTLHEGITAAGIAIHLTAYSVWALVQQFIAQGYFFVRFESLLGSGKRAVLPSALLFASAHLPNPVLVIATALGGLALTEVFRRHRTLYTIAIAHAVIGVAITLCVPDDVHHHMRVGVGYLRYHPGSQNGAGFLPRADRNSLLSEPEGPDHVHHGVSKR